RNPGNQTLTEAWVVSDGDGRGEVRHPLILLVDDDTCGTQGRKAILEMAFPCTVRTAPRGRAALPELASFRFDLVILDYHMPEMNGLELARIIRRIRPTLPMMMLSGDSSVPDEAKEAVDEFVEKGWPPEIFVSAVARLLSVNSE